MEVETLQGVVSDAAGTSGQGMTPTRDTRKTHAELTSVTEGIGERDVAVTKTIRTIEELDRERKREDVSGGGPRRRTSSPDEGEGR